jgi:PST family polysaccharide transporter
MSVLMSIILFLGAELFIRLFYTPEFDQAIPVLRILSGSIIFLFLMNAYGTNYLVLVNQEKKLRKIIVWCSLFGFALSWLAILSWGIIGAAITYLVVRLAIGLISWRVALQHKLYKR